MNEASSMRAGTHLSGVIDTLSAGYGIVNRRPWIVLFPVLLDLFLWLGPQLSAARLVSRTLGWTLPLAGATGLTQDQIRELVASSEGFNLLAALAPQLVGVPSLLAALGIRNPLASTPVESWGLVGLIVGGAMVGGMLIGSLYYAILAQQVRGGASSAQGLVGHTLRSWARVMLYLLLLGGLLMLFGLPLGIMMALATIVSPTLGSLVFSAVLIGVLWLGIYLYFVPDAIFLSQVGPLQAIKNSVAVTRMSLWGTIGLVVLITLILLGMGSIWELVSRQVAEPWGLGLGILGNAYIASGLIAAAMCFYRDRMVAVQGRRSTLAGTPPATREW